MLVRVWSIQSILAYITANVTIQQKKKVALECFIFGSMVVCIGVYGDPNACIYESGSFNRRKKKEHCNGRFFPLYSLFANLFYATKFNSNTFTIIHLILYFTNKLLHSIKNNTFDIGYFQSSCWKESRKHSVHLYVCHLWEIRTGVYITVCLNKKYHLWRPFCLFIGTM